MRNGLFSCHWSLIGLDVSRRLDIRLVGASTTTNAAARYAQWRHVLPMRRPRGRPSRAQRRIRTPGLAVCIKPIMIVHRQYQGLPAFSLAPPFISYAPAPQKFNTMFCKATLLTLALAFVASASPVEHVHDASAATKIGVRIPIQKRGTLTNSDGTFNHARAVREIVKLKK